MILAIDIGNTNIVVGGIDDKKVYFAERLSTDKSKLELEYAIIFKTIMELYNISPDDVEGGIISSVVPPLSGIIKKALEKLFNKKIMVVGPGIKTGLNILTDNPAILGSDLVVDAIAAITHYQAPLIVIDMGTATTMSAIDMKHNYLGTVIIPGIQVSMDSLTSRTSQLPGISLDSPARAIGRNTIESMKSGAVYGNAALIDGMIDRISDELGCTSNDVTVVATGGLVGAIVPHCRHKVIHDDDLLLKGLLIIYKKNVK